MTVEQASILIGANSSAPDKRSGLFLNMANRHGLVAGATGTGKTVTLQVLAEGFSRAGVPVFLTDVKGDLSGVCQASREEDFLLKRAKEVGAVPFVPAAFPTIFWDLYGQNGHPVRTTVSEMGPLLLSRLLDLNDVQQGVLDIAFRVADDEGLLVLDLKDFRALLTYLLDHADDVARSYGNVAAASVSAIQRGLLRLEEQGADQFFGEPALHLQDLMRISSDGRGFINVFSAVKLMQSPRLYATFLLWLLSELFEDLPEVGDLPKPKLVFFFDEAHLLFKDMPTALFEKIEQVVRLVRSKGVGIYFVTQSPGDIPESILAQLGNKLQHALRAYTPSQQTDVRAVVSGFRPNPDLKIDEVIQSLKVGEVLLSVLDESGIPKMVERVLVAPPTSALGPADRAVVETVLENSPVKDLYQTPLDRDSAYERLTRKSGKRARAEEKDEAEASGEKPRKETSSSNRQGIGESLVKSVIRAAGSQVGRQVASALIRGLMGGLSRR